MKNKKKGHNSDIVEALKRLPNPIEDKIHEKIIFFDENRARSNESRFEHIAAKRHNLTVKDIEYIPVGIQTSRLKKDKTKKDTYNYYIQKKGSNNLYIKISVRIDAKNSRIAKVKTIFVKKFSKRGFK